jgi:hypothetical protein
LKSKKLTQDPLLSFNQAVTGDCSDFLGQIIEPRPKYSERVMDVENVLREFCVRPLIVNQYFVSKKAHRVGDSCLFGAFEWETVRAAEAYRPRTDQ